MYKTFTRFILVFFLALGMSSPHTLYAQGGKTVTGTVTDPGGMPLPGVTVQEKGTTNGVATDFDGNFSIDVASNDAVLVFSYVGMTSVEQTVGSQNAFTITMESNEESLDSNRLWVSRA